MLAFIGPIEILVLLVVLLFWASVIAFVVFIVRSLLRKTDQDRAIATLVEENKRLSEALARRQGEDG